MTVDTYGHLIPDPDEREVLDALAERTGGAPIRTHHSRIRAQLTGRDRPARARIKGAPAPVHPFGQGPSMSASVTTWQQLATCSLAS